MDNRDRIEDLEQRIYLAYQEGDYQQAKQLEGEVQKLRGKNALFDAKEPYSIEGRTFWDE
ncbi:hypothetical protein BIZ37_07335 [Photobacterium sp. BZF1]|uniref:hypothetical protein n=1 Tax=Photobacterium TaxID=657 RepID=UPI001653B462|nr:MULTISPECIES: hypothetical protein [Photobacterium]MBC7002367.1 hypothetical protein [Photobacterium sp. BZF1]MBY5944345.1 hypothetical protein [Photobacterium rosenbergii]